MDIKVAYICNGLDPKCSGKVGCFKYPGANFDNAATCWHTSNTEYAATPICEDPESEVPNRFKRYVVSENEIRYFEDPEIGYYNLFERN